MQYRPCCIWHVAAKAMHVQTVDVPDNVPVSCPVKGLKLLPLQPHLLHGPYTSRYFDKVWHLFTEAISRCIASFYFDRSTSKNSVTYGSDALTLSPSFKHVARQCQVQAMDWKHEFLQRVIMRVSSSCCQVQKHTPPPQHKSMGTCTF